jgi:hypothetical protein
LEAPVQDKAFADEKRNASTGMAGLYAAIDPIFWRWKCTRNDPVPDASAYLR